MVGQQPPGTSRTETTVTPKYMGLSQLYVMFASCREFNRRRALVQAAAKAARRTVLEDESEPMSPVEGVSALLVS